MESFTHNNLFDKSAEYEKLVQEKLRITLGLGNEFNKVLISSDYYKSLSRQEQISILVNVNLRFSSHVVEQFENITKGDYYKVEDLRSIAHIGLIKAAYTFDNNKGAGFSTYAERCMVNEVLMELRRESRQRKNISLDNYINESHFITEPSEVYRILPFSETLQGKNNIEEYLDKLEDEELVQEIREIIHGFGEKVSNILYELYGFNDGIPKGQKEVGQKVGASQVWVSRVERRSLDTIRKRVFEKYGLKPMTIHKKFRRKRT